MAPGGRLRRRWPSRRSRFRRASRVGTGAATRLAGTTPEGAALEVELGGRRTVLFFLTSSCYGCRAVWHGLGEKRRVGARLLLVTPSPSTESARDVAALAPGRTTGIDVLMSSETWHAFGVTAAPWFVVAEGGVIVAEGAGPGTPGAIDALMAVLPE